MKSSTKSLVPHYRWDDMPEEQLKKGLSRKLITGERMMIAHVYLKKGEEVPRHSHDNEQLTYILSGALHFWFDTRGDPAGNHRARRRGDRDSFQPAASRRCARGYPGRRRVLSPAPGLALGYRHLSSRLNERLRHRPRSARGDRALQAAREPRLRPGRRAGDVRGRVARRAVGKGAPASPMARSSCCRERVPCSTASWSSRV